MQDPQPSWALWDACHYGILPFMGQQALSLYLSWGMAIVSLFESHEHCSHMVLYYSAASINIQAIYGHRQYNGGRLTMFLYVAKSRRLRQWRLMEWGQSFYSYYSCGWSHPWFSVASKQAVMYTTAKALWNAYCGKINVCTVLRSPLSNIIISNAVLHREQFISVL